MMNEECNANGVKNRNDKADKQYCTELTVHVTKFQNSEDIADHTANYKTN